MRRYTNPIVLLLGAGGGACLTLILCFYFIIFYTFPQLLSLSSNYTYQNIFYSVLYFIISTILYLIYIYFSYKFIQLKDIIIYIKTYYAGEYIIFNRRDKYTDEEKEDLNGIKHTKEVKVQNVSSMFSTGRLTTTIQEKDFYIEEVDNNKWNFITSWKISLLCFCSNIYFIYKNENKIIFGSNNNINFNRKSSQYSIYNSYIKGYNLNLFKEENKSLFDKINYFFINIIILKFFKDVSYIQATLITNVLSIIGLLLGIVKLFI